MDDAGVPNPLWIKSCPDRGVRAKMLIRPNQLGEVNPNNCTNKHYAIERDQYSSVLHKA